MPRPVRRERFPRHDPSAATCDVSGLRNLGPRSAALLASIGVRTRDDLAKLGAIGCCARLLAADRKISLNMAYAIEGALQDCDWRELPHEFRLQLVKEFRDLRR